MAHISISWEWAATSVPFNPQNRARHFWFGLGLLPFRVWGSFHSLF